jgi:Transglycosylase SLT domain
MKATRQGAVLAGVLVALAPMLVCAPAGAEVKTRVRADGTVEIYNDGPSPALRERPLRLKPIPRTDYGDWIREHAGRHGVDPRLVQAIVQVESDYNARARSRKGAVGLMQLMPGTARQVQVDNRYNAEQNIRGGVAYLRKMIDLFAGRLDLAIAAYNAGPGAVQRHNGVPPYAETRDYVDRVLTLYRGSSMMISFGGGGGAPQLNGLAQAVVPSPLQLALAGGLLRAPAQPVPAAVPAAPAEPVAIATIAATTTPGVAARAEAAAADQLAMPVAALPESAPVAMPAAVAPGPVVPATLPVASEPAPVQPATGG